MSQENVEIVRGVMEAFAAGDRERMLAAVDPTVVIDATRRVINPAVYVGHQGVEEMLREISDTWSEMRLDAQDYILVEDRVVVMSRLIGKGRGSGVEVERPFNGQIWTIRDGSVTRLEFGFTARAEALEAAGLSE